MRQTQRAAPSNPCVNQIGGRAPVCPERSLHLLIVEDDADLAACLTDHAKDQSYGVSWCRTAGQARHMLSRSRPDIILLDLNLPDGGGPTFLAEVLSMTHCAVVVITGESDDRIRAEALDLGACDLLIKPFGFKELEARVRSALRRRLTGNGPQDMGWIVLGPWRIDPNSRAALHRDGRLLELTRMEFRLLSALSERQGRLLSREDLIRRTQADGDEVFDRSIDSQISRLRKKLEVDPAQPELILTVWGEGYRLVTSSGEAGHPGGNASR